MKYFFLVLFFNGIYAQTTWAEYKCPIPRNRVSPKVEHEVKFDSRSNTYIYEYALTNKHGPLEIDSFRLYLDEKPMSVAHPPLAKGKEKLETWFIGTNAVEKVSWYTAGSLIGVSKKQKGFRVQSYSKPGIVRYSVSGEVKEDANIDEEICPDQFDTLPANFSEIVGFTIGPVPESKKQVDGEIDLKYKHHEGTLRIDPLDTGTLVVFLKSSEKFSLDEVDIASLEFGMGKAKVKKHAFINEHGKECKAHELRTKHKKQMLKLEFALKEVGVRCNLDYALFLKGKVGSRNLVAAKEIQPVVCEAKHFAKK